MLAPGAVVLQVAVVLFSALLPGTASATTTYTNPVRGRVGADPHIVYSGGYYHLLTTTVRDVAMARAASLDGLRAAPRRVLYSPPPPADDDDDNGNDTGGSGGRCNLWAPEAHRLDGVWYIYFAAGNCQDTAGQRVHVLKGGADPWDDEYTYAGQLTTEWAIDATVLHAGGHGAHLVYSCLTTDGSIGISDTEEETTPKVQSLCIQALGRDYVSLTGRARVISSPYLAFERHGAPVNEGPYALYRRNRTYLSYAASHCSSPAYCVGLLAWDGATDPTAAAAWSKTGHCVLAGANGNYGTGHASFFAVGGGGDDGDERRGGEEEDDGGDDKDEPSMWIVFHATNNSAGACDNSRYSMVQAVAFDDDGRPDFGTPQALSFEFAAP